MLQFDAEEFFLMRTNSALLSGGCISAVLRESLIFFVGSLEIMRGAIRASFKQCVYQDLTFSASIVANGCDMNWNVLCILRFALRDIGSQDKISTL